MDISNISILALGILFAEIICKTLKPTAHLEIKFEKTKKNLKFKIHHLHIGLIGSIISALISNITLLLFSLGILIHDFLLELNKRIKKLKSRIFVYFLLFFFSYPSIIFPQINLLEISQYISNNFEIKNEIKIATNLTQFKITLLEIKIYDLNFDKNINCNLIENSINCNVLNQTNYYTISFKSKLKDEKYELKILVNEKIKFFTLTITLHEDLSIKENSTVPKPYALASDGKRIIVYYQERDLKNNIIYTYQFQVEKREKSFPINLLFTIIIVTSLTILVLTYFFFKNFYKKRFESFLALLEKNEKKVLEVLLQKSPIDQREIVKRTGFSKSLVSKIIKSFKDRGIVKVERRGRTNIIYLIKKPSIL